MSVEIITPNPVVLSGVPEFDSRGIATQEGTVDFVYDPSDATFTQNVTDTASNDPTAINPYQGLLGSNIEEYSAGDGTLGWTLSVPQSLYTNSTATYTITFDIKLIESTQTHYDIGSADFILKLVIPGQPLITPIQIANDYLGITRTTLPSNQVATEAGAVNAGTTTEIQYVNGLLSQATNTTIPAVAVEGSMYGAVGTSAEITKLVTQFLPSQVSSAIQHGFNPQVYASEALGLAFAFGDENGGTAFASHFGPSNASMPATVAGDAAFAAAAASAIFGSAATANTPGSILGFVSNWEAFYASHGVPGIANATPAQIDLAARGAAWGDAVGVALANNLGPLKAQTTEFLMDAAQGIANYSASLVGQPHHHPFQGEMS